MKEIYKDPSYSPEERARDLLSRMTLEEKFAQMRLMKISGADQSAEVLDEKVCEANADRCGQMYNFRSLSPENRDRLQKWAVEKTRLGIPVSIHGEGLHGLKTKDGVAFPQNLGVSCSFNRHLLSEIAHEIGREGRESGVDMIYAPNLDLARDPRWGRVEETFGEDPFLSAEMGESYIKAVQSEGVSACPKHYIAHGSPEAGINLAPVHIGLREFYELMLPSFSRAVKEAKCDGIMPAYSEWDGVPVHASRFLMRKILREKLGFEGVVVSDYGALEMLYKFHHVAANRVEAGKMGLACGVDVEARHPFAYDDETVEAVRRGEIPEEQVNECVLRLLIYKFKKGLFDRPYIGKKKLNFRTKKTLDLARRAGRESVVLLKNENDLLPLSDKIGKIAVIGPNADTPQVGDYSIVEAMEHVVTLRRALIERLGEDRVLYAKGCGISTGREKEIREAVETAKKAEVAVVVVGDNSNYYGGIGWGDAETNGEIAVSCGEGYDNCFLDLPGRQEELLERVAATGTPTILVVESGRPYAIVWASEHVPAILQAWYPGEQGGRALADLLFGEESPSGKLSVSIPRSVGHIPCCYNHKPSAGGYYHKPGSRESCGRDYVFDVPGALYSFGYGLSYTRFSYSALTLSKKKGKAGETVKVSVKVKNVGDFPAKEAVLLFVSDEVCRITPFVEQLKGFDKISLLPGEEKKVTFTLDDSAFSFINEEMEPEVEKGFFTLRVENQTARYEIV